MKARLVVAAAVVMVLAISGVSHASVVGSAHDLNALVTMPNSEVCVACHAPHNPDPGSAPLWNHATTGETFTMYGTTINGTSTDAAPNSASLRCLSCHDGISNMDAFGGGLGTTPMTGTAVVGTDLQDDHPVSITPSADVTVPAGWDFGGKVECGSCHEPHATGTVPVDFLRMSNTNSDLCAACHTTK